MMKKIFVTANLPGESVSRLKEKYEVQIHPFRKSPTKKELIEGAKNSFAIVSMVSDMIDRDVIDQSNNLKIISNCGVGYENIDIEYATSKGICVTNTPDVLTETTADLAWALIFSAARRIIEGDKTVRKGQFYNWEPTLLLGQNIHNKTLGIYGMGRIGTSVAIRAKGFNMKVIYHNRSPNPEGENKTNANYVDFETLLTESDYIVISAPLNDQSAGRFGTREFKKMKKTAILINVGRGKIIKETELSEALISQLIRAAGLDVYEYEPEINKKLLETENSVLLPHMGSATTDTRIKMADMAIESVESALNNKVPKNCVNTINPRK